MRGNAIEDGKGVGGEGGNDGRTTPYSSRSPPARTKERKLDMLRAVPGIGLPQPKSCSECRFNLHSWRGSQGSDGLCSRWATTAVEALDPDYGILCSETRRQDGRCGPEGNGWEARGEAGPKRTDPEKDETAETRSGGRSRKRDGSAIAAAKGAEIVRMHPDRTGGEREWTTVVVDREIDVGGRKISPGTYQLRKIIEIGEK
jgi:hypothetical protein